MLQSHDCVDRQGKADAVRRCVNAVLLADGGHDFGLFILWNDDGKDFLLLLKSHTEMFGNLLRTAAQTL